MTYEKIMWVLKEMKAHTEAVLELNSQHMEEIIVEDFTAEEINKIKNELYELAYSVENLYSRFEGLVG